LGEIAIICEKFAYHLKTSLNTAWSCLAI